MIMKVIRLKTILSYLPEISFLLMAIYWFIDNLMATPTHINYLMIVIALFVVAQMVWRIRTFAYILSVLLGLGSLYMILAVFSEFSEFPKGDPRGIKFLLTGTSIFIVLAAMAIVMPFKYFYRKETK